MGASGGLGGGGHAVEAIRSEQRSQGRLLEELAADVRAVKGVLDGGGGGASGHGDGGGGGATTASVAALAADVAEIKATLQQLLAAQQAPP